jgi:hypothetical protein
MSSNDEAPRIASALIDFRQVPLAEMLTLTPITLDKALQRVMPDTLTAPLPVAAFGSAI